MKNLNRFLGGVLGFVLLGSIAFAVTHNMANNQIELGKSMLSIRVIDEGTALTIADGVGNIHIPQEFNGMIISDFHIAVDGSSSVGLPSVALYNFTDSIDILTTNATIEATAKNSYTAVIPPVVNTNNNVLATGDILRIDVDAIGTGTTGLTVHLTLELP